VNESLLRELVPAVIGVLVRRGAEFAAAEDANQRLTIDHSAQRKPNVVGALLVEHLLQVGKKLRRGEIEGRGDQSPPSAPGLGKARSR